MQEIKAALESAVKDKFNADIRAELSIPDEKFGDLTSNIALVAGKKTGNNPKEVAILLAGELHILDIVKHVEIAGPGFINIHLSDAYLLKSASSASDLPKPLKGQEILVEFGDPNPFKEMHIGHLYSSIAGDSISALLESAGATVHRLSYHGDVGRHVAMAIWAMQKAGDNLNDDLGTYYAEGAAAFASDEEAAAQIRKINTLVYTKEDDDINRLHQLGVKRSFEYFDKLLAELKINYEKNGRYLESKAAEAGLTMVNENTGKVFEGSEGAVIYKGEKAGLHTRVFLTSEGLPTYEAKDLGLVKLKADDYPDADRSIIVTAHEQAEYFKVMLAALTEINPDLANKTEHIYHGFVSLSTGKMSSRTGNVYPAAELLKTVKTETEKQFAGSKAINETYIGAVKYALLKHRLGADIVFDVKESVSLEGNSGPYLQYAYARAASILEKAHKVDGLSGDVELEPAERSLARKISQYTSVAANAAEELLPSHITTYLYELARNFNSFYESSRIVGDEREALRATLVEGYKNVLKSGLGLLNISAPEKV